MVKKVQGEKRFDRPIACKQALLFRRVKRVSRERETLRSRVLARLASLAQIGELARRLIGLQDSYQHQLVLVNVHMYDKFHVLVVLIVLLYTSIERNLYMSYRWVTCQNYIRQLYKHIHVVHHICLTCLLPLLISEILNRTWLWQQNTCLFSCDDFDCSVICTWGTDKRKALIGGVLTANVARTPSTKWELNSNKLTLGKECGSILSSCL